MVTTTRPLISNETIARRRDAEAGDNAKLTMYRAYAEGRHESTIDVAQQRLIGRKPDHAVSDNILRMVLTTAASRLRLERFSAASDEDPESPNEGGEADAIRDYLRDLWMRNQIEDLQYQNTFAYLRDGNSAISMTWRKNEKGGGSVRLTRERWWDGDSGVFVAYNASNEPEWAVKEWEEPDPNDDAQTIRRRTVYYPDQIARYVQKGNGWQEYSTDEQPAVVPWVKQGGRPLGIPIVHFPNAASVTDTPYGLSDLTGLVGLQDDLNATQEDMTAAARFAGFQMVTATGVANGKDYKVVPGGLLWDASKDAQFGTIPPGDPSSISDTHSYKRTTIGVITSTPIHTITGGDWPSGEAILQADMPMTDKAVRLASVAGPRWTQVAHQCTEIANAFGGLGLNEDIPITAVFAPPERINEATRLDVQIQKATLFDLVSRLPRTAMIKTGIFNVEEVDRIIAEREAMDVIGDFAPADQSPDEGDPTAATDEEAA